MLEVILIAMVTTSTVFVVAMLLGSCIKKDHSTPTANNCTIMSIWPVHCACR